MEHNLYYRRIGYSDPHDEFLDMEKKNDEYTMEVLSEAEWTGRIDPERFLIMTPEECEKATIRLLAVYKGCRELVSVTEKSSHKIIQHLYDVLVKLDMFHTVGFYAPYYFSTCLLRRDVARDVDKALGVPKRIPKVKTSKTSDA
jgi:hypothetical protein